MRFGIWVVILCLLGSVINAALIRSLYPGAITPDFSVILTVIIALYHYTPVGMCAAFLLGLLVDFSSAQFLGPNSAGCVLAFCTVGLIANRMYAEKWLAVAIICFVCTIVKSGTYLLMVSMYYPPSSAVAQMAQEGSAILPTLPGLHQILLGEAILTAVISPFLLGVLRRPASAGMSSLGKSLKYGNPSPTAFPSAPRSHLHWT